MREKIKIRLKMDADKVSKAQKIIHDALELNNISTLESFGALSLYGISLAQHGMMDKPEFMYRMSLWWDGIEEQLNEKGPSCDDPKKEDR